MTLSSKSRDFLLLDHDFVSLTTMNYNQFKYTFLIMYSIMKSMFHYTLNGMQYKTLQKLVYRGLN